MPFITTEHLVVAYLDSDIPLKMTSREIETDQSRCLLKRLAASEIIGKLAINKQRLLRSKPESSERKRGSGQIDID